MAPSFQIVDQDSSRNSGGRSRAAVPAAPKTCQPLSTLPPASSLQAVFFRAAPGKQFSFRLPDSVPQTQALPHKHFTATNSETSSRTSTPPVLLFSGRFSTGTSATLASHASSVCSSTAQHAGPSFTSLQPSVPSSAGTYHQVPKSFSDSIPPSLHFEDFDAPETDLPRSTARLDHTMSFYCLPFNMDRDGHSLSVAPRIEDEEHTPQIRLTSTFHLLLCLQHNHANFYGTVLILVFI